MAKVRTKRQKAILKRRIFLCCLCLITVAAIALLGLAVKGIVSLGKKGGSNGNSSTSSPKEPYIVSSATVVNTGDIMVHSTQLDGAYDKSTKQYDFSAFFKYTEKYFKEADMATANLEVTFGGSDKRYSGYPAFNTPDSLADVIKNAGINFLVTSNNHCYDTGLAGLKRTVSVLNEKGIPFTGTRDNTDTKTYAVRNVNGIKIGIANYTYENKSEAGSKSINGRIISTDANALINSFNYDRIDEFYTAAQETVDAMKEDGAEFITFYMHWGEEYQLTPNRHQEAIAQRLSNIGVNLIIGDHPHVIQPIKLIHSEDSENTTVCAYSLGNAISNQRKEIMVPECTTGHTEDGMLFYYKLDKYSDGRVVLSGLNCIPTWVNKYKGGSGYQYSIIPLENENFASTLGLDSSVQSKAAASYERTKAIVKDGLTECQNEMGCEVTFK